MRAFEEFGELLRTFERTLAFVIGDWINELEDRFGEESSQLIDATGWSESTVRVYSWTAKKVRAELRMIDAGLSYKHHQIVAALPPSQQKHWLTQALGNGEGPWPVSRLEKAIKSGEDLLPTKWFVVVECKDASDQAALLKQLELNGRSCKTLER